MPKTTKFVGSTSKTALFISHETNAQKAYKGFLHGSLCILVSISINVLEEFVQSRITIQLFFLLLFGATTFVR